MSRESQGGAAKILEALRHSAEVAVSGESLSEKLGVSRAQVWKHVSQLRKRGYQVEGEPGGGYRLLGRPNRLYPEEIWTGLETGWVGRSFEHFETTDSTNRVAFERGREGAAAGHVVVAEQQSAGRGRLGRSFYSPANENLYSSTLLRPKGSISDAPTLILGAAVAVAETVAEFLDDDAGVEIKWPNDVLIRRKKTSGILMESSAEGTRLAFAVLGIGVNLNVDPQNFPEEFRAQATSLSAERGSPVDRIAFTQRLFRHLEQQIDQHATGGFDAIRPRFEGYFKMVGQPVGVQEMGGPRIDGIARGISATGALELEITEGPRSGERIQVMAGDVTLAKPTRAAQ